MKNLTFGLFIISIISIASCGAISSKGTTINGIISDAPNMKVFLDKMGVGNTSSVISQTDSDTGGSFTFKLEDGMTAGIYSLRIGSAKTFLILEDNPKSLSLRGTLESMRKHSLEVTGSASADDFNQAMSLLANGKLTSDDVKDYINNTTYPIAGMQMALSAFGNRPEFAGAHKTALSQLTKKYPTHEYVKEYSNFVVSLENFAAQSTKAEAIQVGMDAPEITMKSPDGKTYSLSDLKGKVVLLDFWASWCGPCRRANPHVVSVYNKYKDKGFTVFSVSLDGIDTRTKARYTTEEQYQSGLEQTKKNWLAAIEKDQLTWPYHVSELTKWDTPAARQYGVTGIPKTFLIDRDGKIAAVNPRTTLEEDLLKVL